jgi:hypothetical protein
MKVLLDWIERLLISKTIKNIFFIILFFNSIIFANENILSEQRLEDLNLSKKKVDLDSAKQKIEWINPINFTYKRNIDTPNQNLNQGMFNPKEISTISINQPIFRSGGIYNAIKYSNVSRKYQTLDIDIQRKNLIKDATLLLFELNKIDLNIKRQLLQIKNSKIDVTQKKEQVFNNLLDISFLNNAIISLNKNKLLMEDLNLNKIDILNKFNNISSKPYSNFDMPKFTILNKDDLLKRNLYIKKSKINEKSLNYLKKITLSKYLPSISIVHDYQKYHDIGMDMSTTGIKFTIPLDVTSYYDTQSAKISYLKSKLATNIIKAQEDNYISSQLKRTKIIDRKIKIQEENIYSYSQLIKEMIELRDSGLKTSNDVQVLKNSKEIALLQLDIFNINKQIKLLEIYARTN